MKNAPPADVVKNDSSARKKRKWAPGALLALVGLVLVAWFARPAWRASRENPEQLFQRARDAWSRGRLDDSAALLTALSRIRPLSVPERVLRAQVAKAQGRIDDAVAALDGVPDSDPEVAVIWLTRGLLEFERNRPGAAERALAPCSHQEL